LNAQLGTWRHSGFEVRVSLPADFVHRRNFLVWVPGNRIKRQLRVSKVFAKDRRPSPLDAWNEPQS